MSRWPLGLYRVDGDSMLPTYQPGDVVVGWRWFRPRPGQVVVTQAPQRLLIKRIVRVSPESVWLEGDNPAKSTDSRTKGFYPIHEVRALAIAKLRA